MLAAGDLIIGSIEPSTFTRSTSSLNGTNDEKESSGIVGANLGIQPSSEHKWESKNNKKKIIQLHSHHLSIHVLLPPRPDALCCSFTLPQWTI